MGDKLEKVLSSSDVSTHMGKVRFPREQLQEIFVRYLCAEEIESLEKGTAIDVVVMDNDTSDIYNLKLRSEKSTSGYFLQGGWNSVIAKRQLVAGDKFQMVYDSHCGILRFSITSNNNTDAGTSSNVESSK
jgi:hypothetical protein